MDQELTRRSIEPLFKENYYSYDKDEFLLDADFEFVKVRNLLSKSPKLLKEDPILSVDYLKIINLIKQKKLLESSIDQYDPAVALEAHYHDLDHDSKILKQREEAALGMFERNQDEAQSKAESTLDNYESKLDTRIKNDKKAQAREQLKIIK